MNHPISDEVHKIILNWFKNRNINDLIHVRKVIHMLILWYLWLAMNVAKCKNRRMKHQKFIYDILIHLQDTQKQHLLGNDFWKCDGDMAKK